MITLFISVSNRKSILFYAVSVSIIPDHIRLIDHRRNCSAFLLSELRNPRIKIRQALHPDHCEVILRIFRKPFCNVQYVYLFCPSAFTIIQSCICDILEFDSFLYLLFRLFRTRRIFRLCLLFRFCRFFRLRWFFRFRRLSGF